MLEQNVTTGVIDTKMCLFFSLFTINACNRAFKAMFYIPSLIFLHWNTASILAWQSNFLSPRIIMLNQITNYQAYKKYCLDNTFKKYRGFL